MRVGIYLPYRYAPFRLEMGGMPKKAIHLAERLAKRHEVTLLTDSILDETAARTVYGAGLAGVRQVCLPRSRMLELLYRILPESQAWRPKVLAGAAHFREIEALGFDLFINTGDWTHLRNPSPHGIVSLVFAERRDAGTPAERPGFFRRVATLLAPRWRRAFDGDWTSYDFVVTNSRYSAGWLERWWSRKAEVVYSAASDMGPPSAKDNLILSVGRFSQPRRQSLDKRHAVLIEAFRGLEELSASGWRLVLAGSLGSSRGDARYLRELQGLASGLAVEFHPSATIEAIRDLNRRAAIYWHAAGFGSDPDTEPGRQEHFGMTIVEAMSAGSVPVAYGSGGPLETIEAGKSGFHWRTIPELQARTRELASDSALRSRMAGAAIAGSRQFGVGSYLDRMEEIVGRFEREGLRR